jgi:tRNA-dihydrouridine synthase A
MTTKPAIDRRLAIAPMMEWTDRHERAFLRLISHACLLYTEMITAKAILRGDRDYLLGFDDTEHPVALQLGGNDPRELAEAARIGADYGYDEINLNIGCPSDRVRGGAFGASLMFDPGRVADCVAAMAAAVDLPVTVKCRIGVDDQDGVSTLDEFVETVSGAGVTSFIIHARKAWLDGLSPKQNREIPPLDYGRVFDLKRDFPALEICLNGGIETIADAKAHLSRVDGVMIGRAAYQNPYMLAVADRGIFGLKRTAPGRHAVARAYLPYIEDRLAHGTPLHAMTRHILGLFAGRPGAKAWRRYLSENAHKTGANADVVTAALALVPETDEAAALPVSA